MSGFADFGPAIHEDSPESSARDGRPVRATFGKYAIVIDPSQLRETKESEKSLRTLPRSPLAQASHPPTTPERSPPPLFYTPAKPNIQIGPYLGVSIAGGNEGKTRPVPLRRRKERDEDGG
ncbi:hypothetical protein KM043_008446 [Ampulex compressa]|nr:hypothetical protein KM043_008446 [Ampulex compressa]